MPARVLDGRALAARLEEALRAEVAALAAAGVVPRLDVVLVGQDPASEVYVRGKLRACRRVGVDGRLHRLQAETTQDELEALLDRLNADPAVHGILVQSPLPPGLDFPAAVARVDPGKDVDGLHPQNLGRLLAGEPALVACTPLGVVRLLEAHDIPLAGRHAVIVGRSRIVGRPLAALLLARDCTTTVCHRRTPDLARHTRQADLLVVAAGQPGLIGAEHVAPGAVVVDVGIHRLPGGRLAGDVRFDEVAAVAAAITPVPGGVGPMTVCMLLHNTVEAARRAAAPARA